MTRTFRQYLAAVPIGHNLLDRRRRLREAVEGLATAIESGAITPSIVELSALAQICGDHYLQPEARRIRRWIGEARGSVATRHGSVRHDVE